MTTHDDILAADLAALSAPRDGAPIWTVAIASRRAAQGAGAAPRPLNVRTALLALAACVVLVVIVGAMLPSLGKARASARRVSADAVPGYASAPDWNPAEAPARRASEATGRTSDLRDDTPRLVVRRANMDLVSKDVRATFLKAQQLVSEARGEYVEALALQGQEPRLQANLTLRVAADRLPVVLQGLRDLGTVTSESATGEDVTEQAVDLDARLANERRVEAELLQLLASREAAPLKEVLELRESIGRIRESIERMTAQREKLSRLVSLATVLVIIRADTTPEPVAPFEGLGQRFTAAWHEGVDTLVGTLEWLVRVAVGGLVWWAALIPAFFVIRGAMRRLRRWSAAEPPPGP